MVQTNKFIKYKNYYIHRYQSMPTKVLWRIGQFVPNSKENEDNFISIYSTHTLKDAKRDIDKGYVDDYAKNEYKKYSMLYTYTKNSEK